MLCMGLHRVGHDWSDLAAAAACVCVIYRLVLVPFHFLKILVNYLAALGLSWGMQGLLLCLDPPGKSLR